MKHHSDSMKSISFSFTHFAGFDWAKDHHDVVVVDESGEIVSNFRFEDTAEGRRELRKAFGEFSKLAVAVETRSGAVVERLLEGC